MDTIFSVLVVLAILTFFVRGYLKKLNQKEEQARRIVEKASLYSEGPHGLHPHIDATLCIGCATCTTVCPEGDVLAMLGGKAVIGKGQKCIGHASCAE
ncbi:MAG: 4Fe-4S dicluster domain-containing protein, partial [Candidatus Sulfotelmatobacter sp.]